MIGKIGASLVGILIVITFVYGLFFEKDVIKEDVQLKVIPASQYKPLAESMDKEGIKDDDPDDDTDFE